MTVQKENGYTAIANELVDQMCKLHLSGNEWQIVFTVLRKTWGWQKKEDMISLTQFEKQTGLSRPRVASAIKKLVAKNVLVAKSVLRTNEYSFNKVYTDWTSTEKRTSSILRTRVVAKSVPKLVAKSVHTKESKTTNTKEISITNVIEGKEINGLITKFQNINPSYKTLYPKKGQRSALERLIKEHGQQKVELFIEGATYAFGKPFSPTITTPYELENKLGALTAFLQKEKWTGQKLSVTKV